MSKQLLIETTAPSVFELTEARGAPGSGKLVARGEFGRCDTPTLNGRIYSTKLMEREIKRLKEDLENRRVLGQLDHPQSGKSSLSLVSHVITDLWLEADGRVMGEAEILNTTTGRDLRALVEARIPVPVSSRGFGSTRPSSGKVEGEEVQDDFVLRTYDFVADPAVRTAVPTITMESVEEADPATLAEQFLAEFPEVAQQLQEQAAADAVAKAKEKVVAGVDAAVEAERTRVRTEMTEAFEERLAAALLEAREDLGQQLREEYAADPSVGAARATLAQIAEMVGAYRTQPDERAVRDAMKAETLARTEAEAARDAAVAEAQQVRLQLLVERQLGQGETAEAARALLEGVQFTSEQDVEQRLALLHERLPAPGPSAAEQRLLEENTTLRGEMSSLQEKVASLDARLGKAAELSRGMLSSLEEAQAQAEQAEQTLAEERTRFEARVDALRAEALDAYKAAKVAQLANGREVLGLMEDVSSKAEVDAVVTRYGRTDMLDEDLREMRRRLQRGHGDQRELSEGRRGSSSTRGDKDPFGNSYEEMQRLAGLTD